MKSLGAAALECGSGERSADKCAAIHIVGDKEICEIRGNPKTTPSQAEEGLVDAIEGSLDVPGGEENGGTSFLRLLQCVDMLRKNGVNPSGSLVRMLRGVEKGPCRPEALDSGNDDTGPDFPRGFDKCDGSDVVEIDGVKYLRKGGEESPLPERAAGAMFPEKACVVVRRGENGERKGGQHVVGTS